jgi:hypothetical protein
LGRRSNFTIPRLLLVSSACESRGNSRLDSCECSQRNYVGGAGVPLVPLPTETESSTYRDESQRARPALTAELLHVLLLPDFDRADAIGSYWGSPKTRTFAELLTDCEEDRTLWAVLVRILREAERGRPPTQ